MYSRGYRSNRERRPAFIRSLTDVRPALNKHGTPRIPGEQRHAACRIPASIADYPDGQTANARPGRAGPRRGLVGLSIGGQAP